MRIFFQLPWQKGLLYSGLVLSFLVMSSSSALASTAFNNPHPWWEFQSIDTMKYSRDPSRQILHDQSFDQTIEQQIRDIASTGATHVGIATPYDDEFIPVLKRWVSAARKRGLKVWFRGNFSGWESWFGYAKISRAEHLTLTQHFIQNYPELFEDGDVFSACPECENGGPGDPRLNGDVAGHRQFLIEEYKVTRQGFQRMGKNVQSYAHSMNGDVARLVMDPATTQALGGVVTIDHYVATPDQLVADIKDIADRSQGKVILGEYGAPIPDIHGSLTPEEQAAWMEGSLSQLVQLPQVIGVNYWVNVGGSTHLWNDDGSARPGVTVLTKYFKPPLIKGKVVNQWNRPLPEVNISTATGKVSTNHEGTFTFPSFATQEQVTFEVPGYKSQQRTLPTSSDDHHIILESSRITWAERLHNLWWRLTSFLR